VRAATYARLSDDGLSIPDQLASARKYAEDRGWQVVGEFVDKHRSAFRKVEREGFEALLSAADAGKIDAIITKHQDRLTRHPETYGRLLEICVRHSILIHLYTGGVLDLATHAGGFLGMMNTAVAWGESKLRSAAEGSQPATSQLRQASCAPVGWIGLLRILRRTSGHVPPAQAGPWLRVPERREPRLRSPSANRRRAFGGLHRGLRDRPVAEPSRSEDRAVR
jgi:Resolvase, N terminal domain